MSVTCSSNLFSSTGTESCIIILSSNFLCIVTASVFSQYWNIAFTFFKFFFKCLHIPALSKKYLFKYFLFYVHTDQNLSVIILNMLPLWILFASWILFFPHVSKSLEISFKSLNRLIRDMNSNCLHGIYFSFCCSRNRGYLCYDQGLHARISKTIVLMIDRLFEMHLVGVIVFDQKA